MGTSSPLVMSSAALHQNQPTPGQHPSQLQPTFYKIPGTNQIISLACESFIFLELFFVYMLSCPFVSSNTVESICDTEAQNPSLVVFDIFIQPYSTLRLLQNTFYRIKYLVSNGSYAHLMRTIKKLKKSNKKFKICHVIIILRNHYLIILKLFQVIKGLLLFQIKQTTTLPRQNSRTPAELRNCKLENTSLLFGPLAQYLGSDKRWVLSPCVTFVHIAQFSDWCNLLVSVLSRSWISKFIVNLHLCHLGRHAHDTLYPV